jgi:aquaporin Z
MDNKLLVEFLGTMIATIVIFKTGNWAAIGATFAVLILIAAPISQGSFNPAVSFALWSRRQLTDYELMSYCFVEVLGALAGASVSKFIK